MASLLPMADGNARPRFLPTAIADKVSGLHAVYGVLAAIIHKLRTGQGQHVEVPMFESLASFNTLEHLCDNSFVPPTAQPLSLKPNLRCRRTCAAYERSSLLLFRIKNMKHMFLDVCI